MLVTEWQRVFESQSWTFLVIPVLTPNSGQRGLPKPERYLPGCAPNVIEKVSFAESGIDRGNLNVE